MPRLLAVIVAALIVFATVGAHAGNEALSEDEVLYGCGKPKGKFAVSLKPDVELRDLVTWAMGFSCKKFIYASSLASRTSKVTMVTPGTLSPSEAWGLFQTGLASMQLAVVAKGAALEIVESARARDAALAILDDFPDGGAEVVRLLLRPEHVAVEDLRGALDLVKSQYGVVASLPNLHAILVTDDASHVARMKTLVTELDRPSTGDAIYAIPLTHVDAASVAATVASLLGSAPGAGASGTRVVADERSNSLFVAGSASDYLRIRALARAIDLDTGDTAQVYLMKLRYAAARDVAAALGPIAGEIKIAADEASNSLLVLAPARDAARLRGLVEEMDLPRRQVYLEAIILEVESSKTRQIGTSWHLGNVDSGDNTYLGGVQGGDTSSVLPAESLASLDTGTGILGLLGSPISLFGQSIPSIGMLVKANAHSSRLDVLASPHLMTIDNQKATISVGSNIPYKSSSGAVTAIGTPAQDNIQRQKIALTLEITPHVSPADLDNPGAGNVVRLDIKLDSSQLGAEDYGGGLGPTWKERSLETTVVLHDQESIVLGGMVDERIEDVTDGVPYLSDIPVLGALFRSNRKVRLKSNLLIIITPHLIEDTVAGREVLQRRMRERDEFLDAADDLQRRVLQPEIDYRKKRGLLAEIDAVIESIERQKAALATPVRGQPADGRIE